MNGTPAAPSWAAWRSIASRPSGATIASARSARAGTSISCADCIAPGWKAVIWLLSRSVMMNAWAVKASSMARTASVATPQERRRST